MANLPIGLTQKCIKIFHREEAIFEEKERRGDDGIHDDSPGLGREETAADEADDGALEAEAELEAAAADLADRWSLGENPSPLAMYVYVKYSYCLYM